MEIRMVCRCCGSVNPGWTLRSAWKVRIIRPAATSSTSAIATCATADCERYPRLQSEHPDAGALLRRLRLLAGKRLGLLASEPILRPDGGADLQIVDRDEGDRIDRRLGNRPGIARGVAIEVDNRSMETRRIGTQGLTAGAIGLGCMGMTHAYGTGDETESIATIHRAIDCGVTLLDTAEVYGQIGRAHV